MAELHLEVQVATDHALELLQRPERHLHDEAAPFAHEVVMRVVSEVVDGRTVTEVDMVDHA